MIPQNKKINNVRCVNIECFFYCDNTVLIGLYFFETYKYWLKRVLFIRFLLDWWQFSPIMTPSLQKSSIATFSHSSVKILFRIVENLCNREFHIKHRSAKYHISLLTIILGNFCLPLSIYMLKCTLQFSGENQKFKEFVGRLQDSLIDQ